MVQHGEHGDRNLARAEEDTVRETPQEGAAKTRPDLAAQQRFPRNGRERRVERA